jgi:hypothetical protein
MSAAAVLAPVFVQVILTFAIMLWMGKLRIGAVRSGTVHMRDIALEPTNYPPEIQQVSNAFRNQFELPVLFYLVSVLSLFTARSSLTLVVLAWIFVVTRILHALIHVTTNNVPRRFFIYFAGAAILILMWIVYGFSLFFGDSGSLPPLDIEALDPTP